MRFPISSLLVALAAACMLLPAHANDEGTPYKLVLGFPAGGPLDVLARSVAEEMRLALKAPVLVENKPGASTQIAIGTVKNAKPDGRTVLLAHTPAFVLFPMTFAQLSYEPQKDFVPVAHLANVRSALSTGPGTPYKTLPEYVQWVKSNPGQANVGLANLGGTLHFAVLKMAQETGVDLQPVTYKGGAPLATDIMGGHIPLGADALASQLELHRSGKLRILAVTGTQRTAWLPDVPTAKEAGFAAFDKAVTAYGAYVPAGTPKAAVQKLEAAFIAAMKTDSVKKRLDHVGLEGTGLGSVELSRTMDEERSYWTPVVKASGFKVAQ
ncbi:Tripartite-type tricarboxylate transporter, receptor component TctC [Variovorax sp. CF079]|uniref:tripartite tricarboxylate transporter substrate-binding protein n=1 Tax=Variovorax sp. CF079 TaxID=1882774 RepID=UPI00088EF78A|nr:tripartite tricarboxylate transporter substrate-binding protein [Variovorax sp. CF079]SDE69023.1 Tripartite-type tricarboxylate transporter, receptor component TctC [Variovorax sp. CF079]